jgi:hypothetical protein
VASAKAVAYVVLMAVTVQAARTLTPLRFDPRLWVAGAAAAALCVAGALLPSTGTGALVRLVLVVALAAVAVALAPRVLRSMRG